MLQSVACPDWTRCVRLNPVRLRDPLTCETSAGVPFRPARWSRVTSGKRRGRYVMLRRLNATASRGTHGLTSAHVESLRAGTEEYEADSTGESVRGSAR